MSKSKEKRYKYNQDIINRLALKYHVTKDYVRVCLGKEHNSMVGEEIKKEYKKLENLINQQKNNLLSNL